MRLAAAITAVLLAAGAARAADEAISVERGAYLVRAAGCISCHTAEDGPPLAGGLALATPFGTYFSPNITPDRTTGIGNWSDSDFLNAVKNGLRPDGSHLFPVFPYPTYTKMTRADALAIKAWLFAQEPVSRENREHDVPPPFGWRFTVGPWKTLFFTPGTWQAPADKPDPQWRRGAYLVEALTHCGECHTPRNFLGALDRDMWLAGTPDGPDGERVPNITPHQGTGIADWSTGDLVMLMKEGLKPNYDDVQGSMAEAVRDSLSHLTDADLEAIAVYLKTLPPIENKVGKK
ncbi:MAG: cytochrome c [Alphaproteobacteria bacterium]